MIQINDSNRLSYVDVLKGYAILLVILGRSIQNTVLDFDRNIVFRIIYSFHMPLFMILSGIVVKFPIQIDLNRRATRLLLPFVCWGCVSFLLGLEIRQVGLLKLLTHPDYGMWFLYILFLINFWLATSLKVYQKSRILGIISASVLYLILSRIGLFNEYCKFFIAGVALRYILNNHNNLIMQHKIIF
ncbi:MAG: hypothetical protein EKK54_10700 [Neisseriaceae bacterium]|nr:MAG: hypothetical protein EKK54_10700 [Neisseriaceae bacterium]